MPMLILHATDAMTDVMEDDLLSAEPEKRTIELQFFNRFLGRAKTFAARSLMVADTSKPDDSFSANYARMTSPGFKTFFDNLEKTVPERKDFGRF